MRKGVKIFVILTIVALVILLIVQGLIYNYSYLFIKEDTTMPDDTEFTLTPQNFNLVVKKYNGVLDRKNITKELYTFIKKDVLEIYTCTKDLTDDGLERYSVDNLERIKVYNIYSSEEFIKIAEKIRLINPIENKLNTTEVDLDNCEDNENYLSFILRCYYNKRSEQEYLVLLYKNEEKIEFRDYNQLNKMYENYKGKASKEEATKILDNLRDFNIYNLHLFTKDTLNDNSILQFYDLNKSTINNIGIKTEQDYLDIAIMFIKQVWRDFSAVYYYTVDSNSFEEEENYYTAKVTFYFNSGRTISLKLCLANNEEEPQIKIKKVE